VEHALFPGFQDVTHPVPGGHVRAWVGGAGPPLLLLHGYPQTRAIWHKVAPALAQRYTLVAADLRGYGDASKPPTDAAHAPYSKREMARDPVALMQALGFERFFLAGHDRGGRVAHRLAMDHPDRVLGLAVLDISPTLTMYERTSMDFATAYYHWFFLIQPAPYPETMIGHDPEGYLRRKMGGWGSASLGIFAPEAWAEYVRCFTPEAIHASCEDYRAAATIDLAHDREDRVAGRMLACPVLALWGEKGVVHRFFRPLQDWRAVAREVEGRALPAGHYLSEEVPALVAAEFERFFRLRTQGARA